MRLDSTITPRQKRINGGETLQMEMYEVATRSEREREREREREGSQSRRCCWLTLNDISINLTYLQLDLLTACYSLSHGLDWATSSCHIAHASCLKPHTSCLITNVRLSAFQLCAIYVGQPLSVWVPLWVGVGVVESSGVGAPLDFCMCRHIALSSIRLSSYLSVCLSADL